MVNAEDFTYSQGYLGLLSNLGASLGIIFCRAPGILAIFTNLRKRPRKAPRSDISNIATYGSNDEENAAILDEIWGGGDFVSKILV
jgi:hypothetical protein